MKHQSEKPDDQVMQFFTRELYLDFNSDDDDVMEEAHERWEQAILDYEEHLSSIRGRMPKSVRKLAECNFHDADFLSNQPPESSQSLFAEPFVPNSVILVRLLALKGKDTVHFLTYSLWDEVREYPRDAVWPFSKTRRHWLYDEVDIHPDRAGSFLHRILCSDGTVLEIPFTGVIISNYSLTPDTVTTP